MPRDGAAPLVDPALFRRPPASASGCWPLLALFGGVASSFFVLALYLQQGRGLAPLPSGLVFTTMAVAFSATSLAAGRIGRRLGRPPLVIGALVMAVGLGALRLIGRLGIGVRGRPRCWPPLLLDGAGMGLVMAPLAATVLAGLPAQHAGAAAGVLVTAQQLANALGVALIGLVFFGALGHAPGRAAYGIAFTASLYCLVALALVLAVLVRRMQAPAMVARRSPAFVPRSVSR